MQPITYSIPLNPYFLPALCGICILLTLFTLLWLIRPMTLVGKYGSRLRNLSEPDDEEASAEPESVSVIVYGISDNDTTLEYLEALKAQDYPNFDVVLVMDTTAENSNMIGEVCSQRYPNTYVTFIPPGSHNLSRRKLALTLGMKAAKGEFVLTTVSNSTIPSPNWISRMMKPFSEPGTEIVLGYSHINYAPIPGLTRWRREFDDMLTDAQWLGYALSGKPYRGDGYNLAFRKELFFEHKGYAGSIFIHTGDDDIFISEIADGENTKVVLDPESILSVDWGKSSNRIWRERKDQYHFTARWLNRAPFNRLGMLNVMQWIVTLLCIFTAFGSLLSVDATMDKASIIQLTTSIVSILTLVAFWQTEIILYRRAASAMKTTRLWWALPIFWLWQPIGNILFFARHHDLRGKNFTWQR